jgi:hypothetical protein
MGQLEVLYNGILWKVSYRLLGPFVIPICSRMLCIKDPNERSVIYECAFDEIIILERYGIRRENLLLGYFDNYTMNTHLFPRHECIKCINSLLMHG